MKISKGKILAARLINADSSYSLLEETIKEWNNISENELIWKEEKEKAQFLVSERMYNLANAAWGLLAENWSFLEHLDGRYVQVEESIFDLILEKTVDASISKEKTKLFVQDIRNFLEKKEPILNPVKIDRLDWILLFQILTDHIYKTYE